MVVYMCGLECPNADANMIAQLSHVRMWHLDRTEREVEKTTKTGSSYSQ